MRADEILIRVFTNTMPRFKKYMYHSSIWDISYSTNTFALLMPLFDQGILNFELRWVVGWGEVEPATMIIRRCLCWSSCCSAGLS